MSALWILLALVPAAFGAYLIFDFFLWRFYGHATRGVIESFEPGIGGKGQLPVLSFTKEDGAKVTQKAEAVTDLAYILGRPEPGMSFTILYREKDGLRLRVHGYLYLMAGFLLFLPLLAALAVFYSNALMAAQLQFLLIFIAIALGGPVLLKLAQRGD